jgi:cell division septum initiation protein DivIVA
MASQQDETPEIKKLRSEMRVGRTPLLEAVKEAYKPFLRAKKSLDRKNAEIREQVGDLASEFNEKTEALYKLSKKSDSDPATVVEMYKQLSQQAKEVAALIDKELPTLEKSQAPVSKAYAPYKGTLDAYAKYMDAWKDKLPASDFSDRALELVQDKVEKSLR